VGGELLDGCELLARQRLPAPEDAECSHGRVGSGQGNRETAADALGIRVRAFGVRVGDRDRARTSPRRRVKRLAFRLLPGHAGRGEERVPVRARNPEGRAVDARKLEGRVQHPLRQGVQVDG
jgi:hypothetical protein